MKVRHILCEKLSKATEALKALAGYSETKEDGSVVQIAALKFNKAAELFSEDKAKASRVLSFHSFHECIRLRRLPPWCLSHRGAVNHPRHDPPPRRLALPKLRVLLLGGRQPRVEEATRARWPVRRRRFQAGVEYVHKAAGEDGTRLSHHSGGGEEGLIINKAIKLYKALALTLRYTVTVTL